MRAWCARECCTVRARVHGRCMACVCLLASVACMMRARLYASARLMCTWACGRETERQKGEEEKRG